VGGASVEVPPRDQDTLVFFDIAQVPKKGGDWRFFSNFAPARFSYDSVEYVSSEQAFMRHKALLFGDQKNADAILSKGEGLDVGRAVSAMHAGGNQLDVLKNWKRSMMVFKRLGRQVKGYDEALWSERRYELMKDINRSKLRANPALRALLLSTGDARLAEASPYDTVWGVGCRLRDASAGPSHWKPGAQNLLGKLLVELRSEFRQEEQ